MTHNKNTLLVTIKNLNKDEYGQPIYKLLSAP
jgi:hypothetical protein